MRFLFRLLTLAILAALLAVAAGFWWLQQPLSIATGPDGQVRELVVPAGSSAKGVANAVQAAGTEVNTTLLYAWFRLSGKGREIKAGTYALDVGLTPRTLLDRLVKGEQVLRSFTLVEGWNIRDVLRAVRANQDLTQDIDGMTAEQLMARLGYPGVHPEGRFFPDTYHVAPRSPASALLKEAAATMERKLAEAWAQRRQDVPLRSPTEALILASIVEKETGAASDRPMIAGVFSNRLRIGMRLQTDPSVIYGLGERFDGNLRRRDLEADTPYNSYTRAGLPPTPISMPGWASLMAVMQPAETKALYFVARGDGSSHFSNSLDEHNSAVRRYILKR